MPRFNALYQAGRLCVEKDGAHCVCPFPAFGMAGMGERLSEALGVPVL